MEPDVQARKSTIYNVYHSRMHASRELDRGQSACSHKGCPNSYSGMSGCRLLAEIAFAFSVESKNTCQCPRRSQNFPSWPVIPFMREACCKFTSFTFIPELSGPFNISTFLALFELPSATFLLHISSNSCFLF